MIKDIEKHVGPSNKLSYTFRVLASVWDMPIETMGWRYFPDTDTVKPPAFKAGKNWFPSIAGVNGALLKRLSIAIKTAIGDVDIDSRNTEDVIKDLEDDTPFEIEPLPISSPTYPQRAPQQAADRLKLVRSKQLVLEPEEVLYLIYQLAPENHASHLKVFTREGFLSPKEEAVEV